jgi:alpha-glucoside transport system permease protein
MAVVAAEIKPRPGGGKKGSLESGTLKEKVASLAFLGPGALWLLAIVIYPAVITIKDSFFNETDSKAVGLTNYKDLFTTAETLIAFRNNVIWIIIFPFVVTTIGLVLAVLTERIRWATAFKTIIFLPVVFSVTASSMVFAQIFNTNPQVGVANAVIQTVSDWFSPPGAYPLTPGTTAASLASYGDTGGAHGSIVSTAKVSAGQTVSLGLTGFPVTTFQALGAQQAVAPKPIAGAISGVVWRDFSPNSPSNTSSVLSGEDGYPLIHLSLLNSKGGTAASTTTNASGQFTFSSVGAGRFLVAISHSNFSPGFGAGGVGVSWLGGQSLTPTGSLSQTEQALLSAPLVDISMIIAYLWIWAGFTIVVIGAGLAALDRQALEAAEVDGASEWQVLRRVTIPMLAPVLVVVVVTMVINVLKIFDIIINLGADTSEPGGQSSTLASDIYYKGFTNGIHTGLASALAVILFILVIPAMLFNLKRIKGTK